MPIEDDILESYPFDEPATEDTVEEPAAATAPVVPIETKSDRKKDRRDKKRKVSETATVATEEPAALEIAIEPAAEPVTESVASLLSPSMIDLLAPQVVTKLAKANMDDALLVQLMPEALQHRAGLSLQELEEVLAAMQVCGLTLPAVVTVPETVAAPRKGRGVVADIKQQTTHRGPARVRKLAAMRGSR